MKKIMSVLIMVSFLPACSWFWFSNGKKIVGSGIPIQQVREVSGFNEIELYGQGVLILKQGDRNSLTIEADDNLIDTITAKVHRDELRIKVEEGVTIQPKTLIKYYVEAKKVKEVDLHGTAQLRAESISQETFEIEATGNSQVDVSLNVKKLKIEGTGATKFNLNGVAEEQKLELTGSSIYNAGDLISNKIDIESSGAARITINVAKELKAHITGATFIGYKGEPMLSIKQSGAASISKVG